MTLDEMKLAVCEKLPELLKIRISCQVWCNGHKPINWPTEGLQVCHEAEKLLDYDEWQLYIQELQEITLRDKNRRWITPHNHDTATYEQRLEALCRVWFPERFKQ